MAMDRLLGSDPGNSDNGLGARELSRRLRIYSWHGCYWIALVQFGGLFRELLVWDGVLHWRFDEGKACAL